ncbi:MAG: STAS domain-containing protein [Phaeodactylibacter xiamenensis]|uniref:Anti-anti-sigma factor n=1 Tax=Phaeodactylibacter xiamenensis TaxID=1524460 RepID=A0A098S3K3_9BACT|nr:STAS domain-containing protein [Phaeodactylibacter xiamenensis]KGE86929.1 anti-anti-sigma factor [Phaeodactylibacter xiamenensis]MCR9050526.1 STAS domain-containing protein [bacterium]
MEYKIKTEERYTVFTLQEENFNSLIAPDVKSELVLLADKDVKNLIMDLSEVKYVDSSGLSAILTADRLWKKIGSFVLAGAGQPAVKKLMEISRLDTILIMVPTVSEAIDYIFMEDIERELNGDDSE